MADLTITELPRNGVSLDDVFAGNFAAADVGGDAFENSGREIFLIKNDGGGAITATVTSTPDDLDRTQDEVINVGIGEMCIAGPFKPRGWQQTSGVDKGKTLITYSGVTSVTVLVLRVTDG